MTVEAILALMLLLPVFYPDRGKPPIEEQRQVATAISLTDATPYETAIMLGAGWGESRGAQFVLQNRCSSGPYGMRCDPHPRTGKPRALGFWQLWRVACPAAWQLPLGSQESVNAQATCALNLLRGSRTRCGAQNPHGVLAGTFSGFHAKSCNWETARTWIPVTRMLISRLPNQ